MTGKRLIQFIESHFDELVELSEKVMDIGTLLHSFVLIYKYKDENKDKLEIDARRNHDDIFKYYEFKIRFLDYKLLVKELDKRSRILQKWMNQFYDIVSTEKSMIKKYPNKNSIHYKAAIEASEELSKLWFISEVILFGSVSKGEETIDSDIDIAFKVGVDVAGLTETRKGNLTCIVRNIIKKVEGKYEKLMESYPRYLENDLFREKISMFNLLSLSTCNKSELARFEKTGFFEHAVTMFKRDKFEYQLNGIKETIYYEDIACVIVPTDRYYTYIVKVLHDNDEYRYIQYYKHQAEGSLEEESREYFYDSGISNFTEEVILVQKIDKSKRVSHYMDQFNLFPFFNKSEYERFVENAHYYFSDNVDYDIERMRGEISYEIDKGGVRLVKKGIEHPFWIEEEVES